MTLSTTEVATAGYIFTRNCPFDRSAPVQMVVPCLIKSAAYMRSIRSFPVPPGSICLWFLGQNGFLIKNQDGLLIGIDLYLSNSCARTFSHLPFRLDRQLPVFIEPEDLDIDVFIATHSHDDHADPETLMRMPKDHTQFIGPFDTIRTFRSCGVPDSSTQLTHPGEQLALSSAVTLQTTFALPTDATDLNHTGVLLRFATGISFYNTGDTASAPLLGSLLPPDVDICAICINGGFHNLSPLEAAGIVKQIRPRVVIPCHYDMMINNVSSPEMFRVSLENERSSAHFMMLRYYEPWVYSPSDYGSLGSAA